MMEQVQVFLQLTGGMNCVPDHGQAQSGPRDCMNVADFLICRSSPFQMNTLKSKIQSKNINLQYYLLSYD